MGAGTDLIRLAEPASELLVQLAEAVDAELMNIQALGIRARSGDSLILDPARQVEVSPQRAQSEDGSGEAPPRALERDRTFGNGIGERAACFRQLDKSAV